VVGEVSAAGGTAGKTAGNTAGSAAGGTVTLTGAHPGWA
jgi:hypothetical protein